MPVSRRPLRAPLTGAIVTAAIPAITLAGLGAGPAQAATQTNTPLGKAPTHRNLLDAKVQIQAQVVAAKKQTSTVTVRRGDSVWKLAQKHGVTVADVLRLNGLRSTDLIHPGDRLVIRGTAKKSAAPTTSKPGSKPKVGGTSPSSARHTVRSGDTLSGIAHANGVSLSALLSSSGLKASSIIYPGQRIALPGSAKTATSSAGKKTATSAGKRTTTSSGATSASKKYKIKSGDTLSGIAHKHGVSVSALASANGISSSSVIYQGRTLTIPGSSSTKFQRTSSTSTKDAVPNTFLHYTYSAETHRNANASHATLQSRSVPSAAQMESIIRSTATKYGVDPNLAVAHAKVESGLNARAVSPANAVGVMQVLPSTAEWMGQTIGRKLDPLDPYDNVTAGVAYIRYLQRNASSRDQGIGAYYQGLGGIRNGAKPDTKDYIRKVKSYL
ncbi:MAG: LysM peptidoglycan-binding domain-containing protein [Galactobacter sp.]